VNSACELAATPLTPPVIVALAIWGEARGEPLTVKQAVASVIFNRAQLTPEEVPPSTTPVPDAARLVEVCMHPRQFFLGKAGRDDLLGRVILRIGANMGEAVNWFHCYQIGNQLCTGGFEPRGLWTHFHPVAVVPSWAAQMAHPVTIGGLTFWQPKADTPVPT
jgi:hypothetical protein